MRIKGDIDCTKPCGCDNSCFRTHQYYTDAGYTLVYACDNCGGEGHFVRSDRKSFLPSTRKESTAARQSIEGIGMKLELGIMAGAESKAWLADLTTQIDRLEKLAGGLAPKGKAKAAPESESDDEDENDDEEEDEDFGSKKTKGKKAASSFDDDEESEEEEEEEEEEEDEDEEEEEDEKPAKKAKKLTIDDVNDACKARAKGAGKKGRDEVLSILKKKFKVASVTELKPEQYAKAIAAMEA